jgi:galactoside O-acetyltransferase
MVKNNYFKLSDLRSVGRNVIIGQNVRIRYPELVDIGDNVIIDDFTYISCSMKLTSNVHIASGCKIIGGKNSYVEMNEYSTLAPNVVLSAGSDDYFGGIATPMVEPEFKGDFEVGKIIIGRHSIVGSNSVVLPNVTFYDGACLGALSLAKKSLEAWWLYAGIPARKLKARNMDKILNLEKKMTGRCFENG